MRPFLFSLVAIVATGALAQAQDYQWEWDKHPPVSGQNESTLPTATTCNAGHPACGVAHSICPQDGKLDCTVERERQEAEAKRQAAELERETAEAERKEAEAERQKAERRAETWRKSFEAKNDSRLSAVERAAAAENCRYLGEVTRKRLNGRAESVKRSQQSGDTAQLRRDLQALKAWKDVIDKDQNFKAAVNWLTPERRQALEELLAAQGAINWLREAVGEDGNGQLPQLRNDWSQVAAATGSSTPIVDLATKVGLLEGEIGLLRQQLAQQREQPAARPVEQSAAASGQGSPAWLWPSVIALLILVVLGVAAWYGFKWYRQLAPPPSISKLNPRSVSMAAGQNLSIDGAGFVGAKVEFHSPAGDILQGTMRPGRPGTIPLTSSLVCQTPKFTVDGDWKVIVINSDGRSSAPETLVVNP
jgi:hypothetical protein